VGSAQPSGIFRRMFVQRFSWFENTPRAKDLYHIAKVFVDKFIASYPAAPPVIIIDRDDTNSHTQDRSI